MASELNYIPPTVTIDGVIFQIIDGVLNVLLIKRAREPFKGQWALPGGYNNAGETTREALDRVLSQKAGLRISQLNIVEQLHTFDSVARDPRGHAVSIAYIGLGRDIAVTSTPETHNPQFFPLDNLPSVAYDHDGIIHLAHDWLRSKLEYTNVAFSLLPPRFTLTQLQDIYEAIMGKTLDKRNFRKRFLSLGFLEETGEMATDGAHRPAALYTFCKKEMQIVHQHL